MAIDTIGALASSQSEVPRNAGIAQEDFLRILLTQLRFQDPLKPVDNQQFVAQLAQFSSLEINRQQSEKIDTLLTIQATDQAVGLMNKSVSVRTINGEVTGPVTAISFQTGEPRLTVTPPCGNPLNDVRLYDVLLVR